jgi:hypothetical protein
MGKRVGAGVGLGVAGMGWFLTDTLKKVVTLILVVKLSGALSGAMGAMLGPWG